MGLQLTGFNDNVVKWKICEHLRKSVYKPFWIVCGKIEIFHKLPWWMCIRLSYVNLMKSRTDQSASGYFTRGSNDLSFECKLFNSIPTKFFVLISSRLDSRSIMFRRKLSDVLSAGKRKWPITKYTRNIVQIQKWHYLRIVMMHIKSLH